MSPPPARPAPATAPGTPALVELPSAALPLGHLLASRYEVRERLGAGGMGTVYRVYDRDLSEEVALKVLRPDLGADPHASERFDREVKLARKITDPNVCRIYDLGRAEGLTFLTMELLPAETLRHRIGRGHDPPAERLRLLAEVARGLDAAHERGVLHRDLKPENVLIRKDGSAALCDFGLAIPEGEAAGSTVGAGTPLYMSPEQLRGEPLDARSDVFALGLVGYELMTRTRPFGDGPPAVVTSAILRDPPREPAILGLSDAAAREVSAVLLRALDKDPARRWPTAGAFADALKRVAVDKDAPARGTGDEDVPARATGEDGVVYTGPASAEKKADPRRPAEDKKATGEDGVVYTGPGSAEKKADPRGPAEDTKATGEAEKAVERRSFLRKWLPLLVVAVVVAPLALAWAISRRGAHPPAASTSTTPTLGTGAPSGATPTLGTGAPSGTVPGSLSGVGIAVMAFENRTGDARLDALAVNATDAAANAIRTVERVRVTAPSAADWALHGTIARQGDRLRLTGQLRPVGPTVEGAATPAFEMEAEEKDARALLDGVRERAIAEARLLVAADRRKLRLAGCSPEAAGPLASYFRLIGPAAKPSHVDAGLPLLDQAIEKDTRCAAARVERARLWMLRAGETRKADDIATSDRELSIALDRWPKDPDARALRCQLWVFRLNFADVPADLDIDATEDACLEALQTQPDSAAVRIYLARVYDRKCDDERAMRTLEEAVALDAGAAGTALGHLAELTLQNGRLQVADRASRQLVALQEEEGRLGASALARRAGHEPVENAHFIRGEVLVRLGRDAEAASALRTELGLVRGGSIDALVELASLRGLARIAGRENKPQSPEDAQRQKALEDDLGRAVKANPAAALSVAGALFWLDPEGAASWLARSGEPTSCTARVSQAVMLGVAGQRKKAQTLLDGCKPQTRTERACLDWGRQRAGL